MPPPGLRQREPDARPGRPKRFRDDASQPRAGRRDRPRSDPVRRNWDARRGRESPFAKFADRIKHRTTLAQRAELSMAGVIMAKRKRDWTWRRLAEGPAGAPRQRRPPNYRHPDFMENAQ